MRKTSKILALFLVIVTLVSTLAISVSAYSYPMSCTIFYEDEAGKQVAPSKSFSCDAASGSNPSYSSPAVEGYLLKNEEDATVSYSEMDKYFPPSNYVRNGSATYTVVYVKGYYVTIDYKFEDGSQAAPQYQKLYKKGDRFYVSSPTITGFTPNVTMYSDTVRSSNYYRWATYYRNVYTVTYDANGGSRAPVAQSKYWGDTLTLTTSKPSRTGYTFQGWATDNSATSVGYQPGANFTGNYNMSLYAVWQIKTYNIRYDANGGSGAPSTQIKTYGVPLTLSSAEPTRPGYNFAGWGTYSSATASSYAPGGSWTGNYNFTLYAVWDIEKYNISYNANGGENAPASQVKEYGTPLTLSGDAPTRTGYQFLGWATRANSTRVIYAPASVYSDDLGTVLYAVWNPEVHTVTFDANGGNGAPADMEKTYNIAVTLPTDIPTREQHKFLGWSNDPSATDPEYFAGDTYETEGDNTLYAVWEFINYDFSISSLSVSDANPYQYDTVTVRFRLDSWDKKNAYTDVPVTVFIDSNQIYTTSVDFAVYGVQYVTFNVNIGTLLGAHTIEARVNWDDHMNETRTANNSVSTAFDVQKLIAVSTAIVSPNADYIAGNTVVSAFKVENDGASAITPDDGVDFTFRISTYDSNGNDVTVEAQTWSNVVIPANGSNLVYFKWTVPEDAAGKFFYCTGTMNPAGLGNEGYLDDNTAGFGKLIQSDRTSQTPDTRYERTAPVGYQANPMLPVSATGKATWNMWKYENGAFVLESYGIQVTASNPSVTPSSSCTTSSFVSGKWTMKSGYGIALNWNPSLTNVSGSKYPDKSAYTAAQSVYATFPEFAYSTDENAYRTLVLLNNTYQLENNTDAYANAHLHYIPVYVGNGNYTVYATATQIWTPAGMITATRGANTIVLNGSIYDDYYVGN